MKPVIVTLTTDMDHPGLKLFIKSLERFGYPYEIIHQVIPKGTHVFGTQMPELYKWCQKNKDKYSHFIYCDAWDSYVMGSYKELLSKLPNLKWFGSAEKGCFPNPDLKSQYPETFHDWKYVNGGGWFAETQFFIDMVDKNPINGKNDQLWLSEVFLKNKKAGLEVDLDYYCKIFQTTGFAGEDDFHYDYVEMKRLGNLKTGYCPLIAHGNGRTNMDAIYAFEGIYKGENSTTIQ